MYSRIIVVGSMNMDMVVRTSHIPKPGETVLGDKFFMNPGGKGANQAVTVSRLGGEVSFIGRIGSDVFGKQANQLFDEEGIDTSKLIEDEDSPSGIALITVEETGENSIVVAPGANANLGTDDIKPMFEELDNRAILLMQLEIPYKTVKYAAEKAKEKSMLVIINPAPANHSLSSIYHLIDILTPNVSEAEILSGLTISDMNDVKKAAIKLVSQGVRSVIITLGANGALVYDQEEFVHIKSPHVNVVDTTAAGDVFNGALAVGIAEGKTLVDAVNFACQSAAVSVTKLGAQSSIPYRNEVLLNQI